MSERLRTDTHAHAWDARSVLNPRRHYTPSRAFGLEELVAQWNAHSIERAVLVQPSFLADGHIYLEESLRSMPSRLRGVASFQEPPMEETIARLHDAGVRAVRFNLVGSGAMPEMTAAWSEALGAMAARGWHVVIAASGQAMASALRELQGMRLSVVADHFGMPSHDEVAQCPGFAALRSFRRTAACFIKLSAPYRATATPVELVRQFNSLGFQGQYVWGSDCPFTRFEGQTMGQAIGAFEELSSGGLVDPVQVEQNATALYFH